MQPDDAAVVARAKGGDDEAFRLLVERHGRSVYRLAFRVTGSKEDAEDVVQETLVRAYRQLDRFEARSNVGTWLYRIGFNCAVDLVRARGHRDTTGDTDSVVEQMPERGRPSADDLVFAGQIGAEVQRALRELTLQERTAFVLRHYHGCSIEEISSVLDVTGSAAKHAIFRAVRKMRAALAPFVTPAAQPSEARS